MKYSQLLGCLLVLLLAGVCFLPWSYIAEKNLTITGFGAAGTIYGKPGMMHLVLGCSLILFFLIPAIWAKRINVFIAAINVAWTVRNCVLLTTCYLGECPKPMISLYLTPVIALGILIMTFLPDLKTIERKA